MKKLTYNVHRAIIFWNFCAPRKLIMSNKERTKESTPKALSVKINFLFSIAIQILTYLIPLITAPYLSRVLTPTGIGNNSFASSVANYFILIISFGFGTYGTREVAVVRNDKTAYSKTFWNVIFSKGFLFILCFTAYFLMAYLWGFGSDVDKNVFLIYSLLLVNAFLDITYLFQGLENFRILAILSFIFRVAAAVLYFIFIKTSDDLLIYVVIATSSSLLVTLIAWMFALRWIKKPSFKDVHIFQSLKNCAKYFIPTAFALFYATLDKTMLGFISTTHEVGIYEEANKIINICLCLMLAISPIILSRISSLTKEGKEEEVKIKENQTAEVYFLIGLPMLAGLYLVARYFIPAFFGEEYAASTYVMYCLAPLILIMPISNIIGSAYYLPRNKVIFTTIFISIGFVINLGLNFLFIYYFGAEGAAIASVISETIISALYVIFSWKYVPYKDMLKKGIKPLIASTIMVAVLLPLELLVLDKYVANDLYTTIIAVLVGMLVYGISIILLKEEMVISTLNKVFKRKPKQISIQETNGNATDSSDHQQNEIGSANQ